MPDIFGNPTAKDPAPEAEPEPAPEPEWPEPIPQPEPPDVSVGDVVEIPHKATRTRKRTGYIRRIEGASAWVESDIKKVTGWYALVCLAPYEPGS